MAFREQRIVMMMMMMMMMMVTMMMMMMMMRIPKICSIHCIFLLAISDDLTHCIENIRIEGKPHDCARYLSTGKLINVAFSIAVQVILFLQGLCI